jgi:hypothetical protein
LNLGAINKLQSLPEGEYLAKRGRPEARAQWLAQDVVCRLRSRVPYSGSRGRQRRAAFAPSEQLDLKL